MTQDDLEFSISQYADGSLPEAQRTALEARLASDADARAMLAEHEALDRLLRQAPIPQIRWDRLTETISNAIDDELESRMRQASWWMRVRVPAFVAMAASVLIAAGITVQLLRSGGTTPPNPQMSKGVQTVLDVRGPDLDVESGPEVTDVAIGPGGSYAKASSLAPYADDIDTRPSRVVVAAGVSPAEQAQSQSAFPF